MNYMHDPLTRAAIRYGSDKYGAHLYTPIYHRLLAHLRETPVRLLEIGIGGYERERAGGLGLRMWAEYFPYGQITGLDIVPKKLDLPPRVKAFQGSQIDETTLAKLNEERGPFDIVIDDGSHQVPHVEATFRLLYPRIAPNGIYVVEDTQTAFMPAAGGQFDGSGSILDIAHKVQLAMHTLDGYTNTTAGADILALGRITASVAVARNLAIFQRGDNDYPSNGRNFDIDNPLVRGVFDGIATEAKLNPSAGSYITRIDMLRWAGRHEEAAKLAVEAATRFPNDTPALHYLAFLMRQPRYAEADAFVRAKLMASSA